MPLTQEILAHALTLGFNIAGVVPAARAAARRGLC